MNCICVYEYINTAPVAECDIAGAAVGGVMSGDQHVQSGNDEREMVRS